VPHPAGASGVQNRSRRFCLPLATNLKASGLRGKVETPL
jgi:hypothetical protein